MGGGFSETHQAHQVAYLLKIQSYCYAKIHLPMPNHAMTPKERMFKALQGEKPDVLPAAPGYLSLFLADLERAAYIEQYRRCMKGRRASSSRPCRGYPFSSPGAGSILPGLQRTTRLDRGRNGGEQGLG